MLQRLLAVSVAILAAACLLTSTRIIRSLSGSHMVQAGGTGGGAPVRTARVQAFLDMIQKQDQEISKLRAELARLDEMKRRERDSASQRAMATTGVESTQEPAVHRGPLIAHVINPMPLHHGLHADQQITFASMAAAAAAASELGIMVRLYTAELVSDLRSPRPAVFEATPNLTRHAHGAYDMQSRGLARRSLPLISDILGAAYNATRHPGSNSGCEDDTDDDRVILVYTNADIGVQRDFYSVVARYASSYLAFVINRVEVPERDSSNLPFLASDLEELYELAKRRPQLHAGYDCFIWRRPATPLLRLYTRGVFVGYPPIGRVLRDALSCVAGHKFMEVRGQKHTFHVGNRNGGWSKYPEYEHFNRKAAKRAERDFASVVNEKGRAPTSSACATSKNALAAPSLSTSRHLRCRVDAELQARSFIRWDEPGSEWPPRPAR